MTGFLDGITINTAPGRAHEEDRRASTDRLCVSTVRKMLMPHDRNCNQRCRDRNHRRDSAYLQTILGSLGLPDEPALPGDYQSKLDWASMSAAEAAHMNGRM